MGVEGCVSPRQKNPRSNKTGRKINNLSEYFFFNFFTLNKFQINKKKKILKIIIMFLNIEFLLGAAIVITRSAAEKNPSNDSEPK
jgi:hypothetical protein